MRSPRRFLAIAAALPLLLLTSCGHDIADIRTTFESYQKAVAESKAADAAKLIDSWSANWYAEAARHAATSDQFVLEQLDPLMIKTVLQMRSAWTKAELAAMSGRDALAAMISKGWAGRDDLDGALAEVRVDGNDGKASTTAKPLAAVHMFRKEGEAWLASLRHSLEVKSSKLRADYAKSGTTAGQFVLGELRKLDPGFDSRLLIGPREKHPEAKPAEPNPADPNGESPKPAPGELPTVVTPEEMDTIPVIGDEPEPKKTGDEPAKPAEPGPETPAGPDTPASGGTTDKPSGTSTDKPSGDGGLIPKRPAGGTPGTGPDAPAK